MSKKLETAILGGGCFWCTEAIFQNLKGVITAGPGYAGGHLANPSYEQVSSGTTGHAEVVKIEFDPRQISYRDLLEVFFATHDPTSLNRQGEDVGEQYRSIILYTTPRQRQETEKFIEELKREQVFQNPIITQIKPLEQFFEAEEYHKNYYNKNLTQGYCRAVINPKLHKFKEKFASLLK